MSMYNYYMHEQELVNYIKDARKSNIKDAQITEQLIQEGWDSNLIAQTFKSMTDEYESKKKKFLWPKKMFFGRINRTEFIIGYILLVAIFLTLIFLNTIITSTILKIVIYGFLAFFYFSLCTRRISDIGIKHDPKIISLVYFSMFIIPLLLFGYLIYAPGQSSVNEDGYPPEKFNGSIRNLLALK